MEVAAWVTVWTATVAAGGPTFDLRAGGDVLFDRFVARVAERKPLFEGIGTIFADADLAIANLESPLTRRAPTKPGPYRFAADPRFAGVLRDTGFDLLSVRNNHALDAGEEGLDDTLAALHAAGLKTESDLISTFDFTEPNELRNTRRIAFVHWGNEYETTPSARQRRLAETLAAQGAQLIIGAHPHVIQPVQRINNTLVAYSLGNLLFDQPHRGLILRAIFDAQRLIRADVLIIEPRQSRPAIPELHAYNFDGHTFQPSPLKPTRFDKPSAVEIDLRGDGHPLKATLQAGVVEVGKVWKNEHPSWKITAMYPGDPDRDGRLELMLLVHKNGGTHPFIMGERSGRYRIIWGGSATKRPIRDLALGDFDGDARQELAVLDGEGELSIWRWYTWGFEEVARSSVSRFAGVHAQDLDGDGKDELVLRAPSN